VSQLHKAYVGLTFAAENEDGTRTVPISPYGSSRWSQLKTHFGNWRSRALYEFMSPSDRTLRDIGVARCDAGIQGPKLFWLPRIYRAVIGRRRPGA
jgi:uncharacterized protein YjiS (DUF1127 family)